MRSVFIIVAVAATLGLSLPATGEAASHRVGSGLEFDAALSDVDSAFGGYVFYEFDLPEPITAMFELSYSGGDFDVESGSGSYTVLGVGAALMLRHSFGDWTGYVGAGGANCFNDFDSVNYDDKLSLFVMGGARIPVEDRLSADLSIRYRALRIDSIDNDVEPDPLNADAIVFRVGIVLEL